LVAALCYKPEVAGWIPDVVIGFLNLHDPSSGIMAIMAMGSTQRLTEISTPARKADNLTAISEPTV
jgi:hypothetical protein